MGYQRRCSVKLILLIVYLGLRAAPLEKWLEKFSKKMEVLDESTLENENWRAFVRFYRQVLEDARFAIRCGLTVHAKHGKRGYGTQLIKESDAHLKELGYEYVLVHATSPYSQRIFSKEDQVTLGILPSMVATPSHLLKR